MKKENSSNLEKVGNMAISSAIQESLDLGLKIVVLEDNTLLEKDKNGSKILKVIHKKNSELKFQKGTVFNSCK